MTQRSPPEMLAIMKKKCLFGRQFNRLLHCQKHSLIHRNQSSFDRISLIIEKVYASINTLSAQQQQFFQQAGFAEEKHALVRYLASLKDAALKKQIDYQFQQFSTFIQEAARLTKINQLLLKRQIVLCDMFLNSLFKYEQKPSHYDDSGRPVSVPDKNELKKI